MQRPPGAELDRLPLTAKVIGEMVGSEKPYLGAQIYVSHRGAAVADSATGEAKQGVAMTPDTMVNWLCCSKVATAIAVAQLWEEGALDIDRPVREAIPEFATGGKEEVTARHLLTHTGGFVADPLTARYFPRLMEWEEAVQIACEVEIAPGARPGRTTTYSVCTGFVVLGELIRRITGSPPEEVIEEGVFRPLGMESSSFTLPPERLGDDVADIYFTGLGFPVRVALLNDADYVGYCSPGASGRGPVSQLARLGELLLGGGAVAGKRVVSPQTAAALSAVHRSDIADEKFGDRVNWGLGLMADPWLFGLCCGPRTVGHKGFGASMLLVDPDEQLVIASFMNGIPKGRVGVECHDRLVAALYEDLGLVDPGTLRSIDEARAEGKSMRPRDRFFQPMGTVNPTVAAWRNLIGDRNDEELVQLLDEHGGIERVLDSWFDAVATAMSRDARTEATVAYLLENVDGQRLTYVFQVSKGAVRWTRALEGIEPACEVELTSLDFVRMFAEVAPAHDMFLAGRIRVSGDWSALLELPNVGETLELPPPVTPG
uniref:Beta-lactamase n=1 Tax=uncultured bacterium AB_162 TaxID=1630011 RepID=A0A0E3GLV1_9BACT|nr:beta-lactamase [uncultured bacterium AB_162]